MWMEIWIHSVGWDTNFISLNPVHLNPLSNADFSLCRLCNIPYQISHSSVLARASLLSLYPEYLCSECSLCYVCVPWGLLPLLTYGNEERIKIRSCLQTKKILEKLCMTLLAAAFMAEEILRTVFVGELWELVSLP